MIELPGDIEPHLIDGFEWSDSGVYALALNRPDDLEAEWDAIFESRPDYFETLQTAETIVYVGAAKNVISRLEDHVEGRVRKAALLQVCEIESVRNIWWMDSTEKAFERESGIAIAMQNEYPSYYVHSR